MSSDDEDEERDSSGVVDTALNVLELGWSSLKVIFHVFE